MGTPQGEGSHEPLGSGRVCTDAKLLKASADGSVTPKSTHRARRLYSKWSCLRDSSLDAGHSMHSCGLMHSVEALWRGVGVMIGKRKLERRMLVNNERQRRWGC